MHSSWLSNWSERLQVKVIISRDVVFQVTLIPYLKTEIESSKQAQPASTHVEVEQDEDQLE